MLHKLFAAEYKALGPEEGGKKGEFEAVVAVYDNVDREGDRVKSGAFDRTLKAWQASGDPIPIVLAHQWGDAWAHIGYAMPGDVKSVPGRGLVVQKGVLDIDDNPLAKQVHRLMERRTLKEFSFGYRIAEGGEQKAEDGAYDLTDLDLIEFGPCLKGINEETELLAVKAEVEAQERRRKGEEPTLEERVTALEKAYVQLPGSLEERQKAVGDAVRGSYQPETPGMGYVEVEATYSDRVVFCVYGDEGEGKHYEAPYTYDAETGVQLGEASEVEVEATVTPKADEPGEREDGGGEGEKAVDLGLTLRLAQIEALEVSDGVADHLRAKHTDKINGVLSKELAELETGEDAEQDQ